MELTGRTAREAIIEKATAGEIPRIYICIPRSVKNGAQKTSVRIWSTTRGARFPAMGQRRSMLIVVVGICTPKISSPPVSRRKEASERDHLSTSATE
jgi:hypothetical protein